MVTIRVRDARLGDLQSIAAMLKDSFDAELWPYMTYAQRGIDNYLALGIRYPSVVHDRRPYVVTADEDSERPIAFADFRIHGDGSAFLSYICVNREARGKGAATALILHFLEEATGVRSLQLDTFDDNIPAGSLYAKLGFAPQESSLWIDRSLPARNGALTITAPEAALASYDQYGFCELMIGSGASASRVGLLGPLTIRCFSLESFKNNTLLAGVRQVFPDTDRAFTIVAEGAERDLNTEHRVIKRSIRMNLVVQS
jgi:ribosomal protein S18 acetylase RimI-like enzyme